MLRTFLSALLLMLVGAGYPYRADVLAQSAPRPAAKVPAAGMVNINTASASELEGLPGIGAKTAARIVEYRQKNGPFKKIEELMNVRGVGEKNFLKLKSQITVAGKAEHAGQQ